MKCLAFTSSSSLRFQSTNHHNKWRVEYQTHVNMFQLIDKWRENCTFLSSKPCNYLLLLCNYISIKISRIYKHLMCFNSFSQYNNMWECFYQYRVLLKFREEFFIKNLNFLLFKRFLRICTQYLDLPHSHRIFYINYVVFYHSIQSFAKKV